MTKVAKGRRRVRPVRTGGEKGLRKGERSMEKGGKEERSGRGGNSLRRVRRRGDVVFPPPTIIKGKR